MRRKPALDAFGVGLRLADLAALVLAFPLAERSHAGISGRLWMPSPQVLGLSMALAVALWVVCARANRLYEPPFERSALPAVARAVRAFATTALVLVAVAFLTNQQALPRLLVGLYLGFALALVVGIRVGWSVLATAVQGAPSAERRHPEPPAERELGQAGSGVKAASAAPSVEPGPEAPAAADPESVLRALRTRMDDVTYFPGHPNVLSMTKYLHGDVAAADGGAPVNGTTAELAGLASAAGRRRPRGAAHRLDGPEGPVLRVEGMLDAITVAELRPLVEAVVAERAPAVTVDLSSLRRIDSAGVGVIVSLIRRCRAFGGAVRVAGLRDQPLAVFRVLQLDRLLAAP
jgi:anti-sigma B factor antagonist